MKFSYNWLKELSGTKESPEKIAEKLTLHSFEVEEIIQLGKNLNKVVIGKVLKVEKHPNADKLNVTKVNVGKEELQIVCGAPNLEKDQKVPVALVGAVLGEGFEIKEAELRGVKSQGMICAEDELGLREGHEGIMVLDKNAPVGENLATYLKLDDTVLDIDILPNRAHDALSHEGVALEILALASRKSKVESRKLSDLKKDSELEINIDTNKCNRYIGVKIKNIKIGESSDWIKSRLVACGLNPINNIVDITNYIMLETGQPLHAFDASKVEKILVRQAKSGEELELLDDSKIKLTTEDIIITDGKKPIALAGIMGGKDSAIDKNTSEIILESASFDAVSIRASQKHHSLKTDAGYRFERNLDPNISEHAITKAISMIIDKLNGEVEITNDIYPEPILSLSLIHI